jgi:hypothetical protein
VPQGKTEVSADRLLGPSAGTSHRASVPHRWTADYRLERGRVGRIGFRLAEGFVVYEHGNLAIWVGDFFATRAAKRGASFEHENVYVVTFGNSA